MDAPNQRYDHAYAIIRIDPLADRGTPPDTAVTVKMIVWSEQKAAAEVKRLNALRPTAAVRYTWQLTRIERRALERGAAAELTMPASEDALDVDPVKPPARRNGRPTASEALDEQRTERL